MDDHRSGDDLAILVCALAGMAAIAGAAYLFRRSWTSPSVGEATAAILKSGSAPVKGLG